MNMIMHDVHYKRFDIKNEDTLERPQHIDQKFEAIVANPPFSAHWSASPLFMSDDRFSQYGKLAPGGKADFAFVQHMVHHLAENGQMAVVLPHGALFRGNAEEHIRKYLIKEKNCLDAVIGLPTNLFYGTPIPTCILVFKKCRENPNDVLFIDSSKYFERGTQNTLRDSDIVKLVSTYQERSVLDKYSYIAPLSEIEENEYNLNIPRYVNTFEEEEIIEDAEFTVVEDMPSFPGCDNLETNAERKKCTEENLMKYIYKNIKYPTLAKDNDIQGMVVVSFVVDKNGKITDTKIIKDIGGGCGEEAEKVILTMNSLSKRWTPGMQRAQKVKVRYNMPIRFRLSQN